MSVTVTADSASAASLPLKTPPRLKGGLPLIGHTIEFARDPVGLLQRAYDECGRVARRRARGAERCERPRERRRERGELRGGVSRRLAGMLRGAGVQLHL